MPSLQSRIQDLLDLIPDTIEPDEEVPNLYALRTRIALLDRQQLALSLHAWIERNHAWIGSSGFVLHITRENPGPYAARFPTYSVATPDGAPLDIKLPVHAKELDYLINLLTGHFDPVTIQFAELVVEDLNAANWKPADAREALVRRVAGLVENPGEWLARHTAARQAKNLHESTPGTTDMKPRRGFKVLRLDSHSLLPIKRRL